MRATQGDSIFFRIPEDQLYPSGLKRKKRLLKYNQYKEDVYGLALSKGFKIPVQGMSIKFFIPVPKTWGKKKKAIMHGKLHQNKPDIDNLMKAVLDSLLSEDKKIGQIGEIAKIWVNEEAGWIEITVEEAKYEEVNLSKSGKVVLMPSVFSNDKKRLADILK